MNLWISGVASRTRSLLIILALFLPFAPGWVSAQCTSRSFSLSGPATTWNGGNGSWAVDGNWTSGAPNSSTNACILDGTSTVTLDTIGNANGVLVASGNSLNVTAAAGLSLTSGGSSFNFGIITNAGAFTNNGSIEVDISPAALVNDSGGHLTNGGTISLVAGAALINNSGGSLINNGTVGGLDFATISNSGTFVNNSAIQLVEFNDLSNTAGASFVNSGTISGDSLYLLNQGTFDNTGTISVLAHDPSSFSNSGTFNNSGATSLDISCVFGGCSNSNNSSNSGTINNGGVFNITRGSAGGDFTNSGTINNTGTLSDSVASVINNTGTINNRGTINNIGTINNVGTINNSGTFANSGAVTISGILNTSSSYMQTAGSTLVDGTLRATGGAIVNIQGGTLGGTGTINGNVEMGGMITAGDTGAPGTLTILGNYEQTGTGILEELIGPSSHSFLDVSGDVALYSGSRLDIMLLDGYDPLGQTFEIMDYSSLEGGFANGWSFWDDGYLWDVTYGRNQLDVTAVSTPEPKSLPFLFIGLIALVLYGRRKLDIVRSLA